VRSSRSSAQRGSEADAQLHASVLRSTPQVGHNPKHASLQSANPGTANSHSSRTAGRMSTSREPDAIGTTSSSSASSRPTSANSNCNGPATSSCTSTRHRRQVLVARPESAPLKKNRPWPAPDRRPVTSTPSPSGRTSSASHTGSDTANAPSTFSARDSRLRMSKHSIAVKGRTAPPVTQGPPLTFSSLAQGHGGNVQVTEHCGVTRLARSRA